jgi:hypothetical protein
VDPTKEFLIDLAAIADIVPETLVSAQSSGVGVPGDVAVELEKRLSPLAALPPISSDEADDPVFDPDSL